MSARWPTLLLCAAALPAGARASADFRVQGFLELRLAHDGARAAAWTDGGLGKARFGEGDEGTVAGALSISWQPSKAWLAVADLQAQPQASPTLGVLSAYLRWRPVPTSRWRPSARIGAFFPPVSLENEGVGWTSPWTLTPSAINSWVGEELRTVGVEGRLEHRGERGTLEAGVGLFRWNDPAGELIATRGWALGDLSSALGSAVRQPDVLAAVVDAGPPVRFKPFVENDGKTGWHADLQWTSPGGMRMRALRYDNRAEPDSRSVQAGRTVFSWQTRFSSLGAQVPVGDAVLVGQWMDGSTIIEPSPAFQIDSRFRSRFVLVAWQRGRWRPALRYDDFRVRVEPESLNSRRVERGHAWTAALNWRPREWLRVTAEWLRIDSTRPQRVLEGLAPRQREDLLQLNLRYQF